VDAVEAFFSLRDWEGLWLGGGTCLAEYWFGHRVSVDLDLFTADEDLFRDARAVLSDPSGLGPVGTLETVRADLRRGQHLLSARSGAAVKVDVVLDLPAVLGDKVRCGDVWLDSLPDLAADKMGCLLQREDPKDYVDLFYLLPHLGLGTAEALDLGLRKEAGLDPLLLAAQVEFIRSVPRPDLLRSDVPWANVQGFFASMRADLLRMIAP
jgi:hypothetical protein